jgi:hypothetical protein
MYYPRLALCMVGQEKERLKERVEHRIGLLERTRVRRRAKATS